MAILNKDTSIGDIKDVYTRLANMGGGGDISSAVKLYKLDQLPIAITIDGDSTVTTYDSPLQVVTDNESNKATFSGTGTGAYCYSIFQASSPDFMSYSMDIKLTGSTNESQIGIIFGESPNIINSASSADQYLSNPSIYDNSQLLYLHTVNDKWAINNKIINDLDTIFNVQTKITISIDYVNKKLKVSIKPINVTYAYIEYLDYTSNVKLSNMNFALKLTNTTCEISNKTVTAQLNEFVADENGLYVIGNDPLLYIYDSGEFINLNTVMDGSVINSKLGAGAVFWNNLGIDIQNTINSKIGTLPNGGIRGGSNAEIRGGGQGSSMGKNASAVHGSAGGVDAYTSDGVAAGQNSYSSHGAGLGKNAMTGTGVAAGQNATTISGEIQYDENNIPTHDNTFIDAIQLGVGNNPNAKTFKVYDYPVLNASGSFYSERYGQNSISGEAIKDATITGTKIQDKTLGTNQISDNYTNQFAKNLTNNGFRAANGTNTSYGVAIANHATTSIGVAIGYEASSSNGAAIGPNTHTSHGASIGQGAVSLHGLSGGRFATTIKDTRYINEDDPTTVIDVSSVELASDTQYSNAIQLGQGNNPNDNTFQVYQYQLLDANGKIPNERLNDVSINTEPLIITSGDQLLDCIENNTWDGYEEIWLKSSIVLNDDQFPAKEVHIPNSVHRVYFGGGYGWLGTIYGHDYCDVIADESAVDHTFGSMLLDGFRNYYGIGTFQSIHGTGKGCLYNCTLLNGAENTDGFIAMIGGNNQIYDSMTTPILMIDAPPVKLSPEDPTKFEYSIIDVTGSNSKHLFNSWVNNIQFENVVSMPSILMNNMVFEALFYSKYKADKVIPVCGSISFGNINSSFGAGKNLLISRPAQVTSLNSANIRLTGSSNDIIGIAFDGKFSFACGTSNKSIIIIDSTYTAPEFTIEGLQLNSKGQEEFAIAPIMIKNNNLTKLIIKDCKIYDTDQMKFITIGSNVASPLDIVFDNCTMVFGDSQCIGKDYQLSDTITGSIKVTFINCKIRLAEGYGSGGQTHLCPFENVTHVTIKDCTISADGFEMISGAQNLTVIDSKIYGAINSTGNCYIDRSEIWSTKDSSSIQDGSIIINSTFLNSSTNISSAFSTKINSAIEISNLEPNECTFDFEVDW